MSNSENDHAQGEEVRSKLQVVVRLILVLLMLALLAGLGFALVRSLSADTPTEVMIEIEKRAL